jgi:hypothetical protein
MMYDREKGEPDHCLLYNILFSTYLYRLDMTV